MLAQETAQETAFGGGVAFDATIDCHRPGEPGYRLLLTATVAAAVSVFAAFYSAQPLIGVLARHFAIASSTATWAVSLTALFLGIGMVIAVPMSRRFGRARVLKGSAVATAALATLCALAPTWPALLVLRALLGLSAAGTPAVALAYIREEVHPLFHPRASGIYIGGAGLGAMAGRVVAGGVVALAGWRWSFGAIALLSGLCALVVTGCLPAPRYAGSHEASAETRAESIASADAATNDVGAFWRALCGRRLLALYVTGAVLMGAVMAVYDVLALRLSAPEFGLTLFAASFAFCDFPIGSAGSVIGGHLAERFGHPRVILLGGGVAAIGLLITLSHSLPLVILGVAVFIFGFFAAHGVASGWAATLGHQVNATSQASTVYMLAYYIGGSLFGAVGAALWVRAGWPAVVAVGVGLCLTAAGIGTVLLAGSRRTVNFSKPKWRTVSKSALRRRRTPSPRDLSGVLLDRRIANKLW
ncbi:MAG: MFS transporter [Acidimicrobiales bacterium]|jgi:YNFM family putative membrane transporter